MTLWERIWCVFLQFWSKLLNFFWWKLFVMSAFTKNFFENLRMIEIGPRGRWKRSSIFQTPHRSQKSMLSNALSLSKNNPIYLIFHQNFAKHTFSTLAPPSGYALNLKALIKVSIVSWTSQLSNEIFRFSFERKFYKTHFIPPKRKPPKSPHHLGLTVTYWF